MSARNPGAIRTTILSTPALLLCPALFPEPDHLVVARPAGSDRVARRVATDAEDRVSVSTEALNHGPVLEVPQVNGVVLASAYDVFAVRD